MNRRSFLKALGVGAVIAVTPAIATKTLLSTTQITDVTLSGGFNYEESWWWCRISAWVDGRELHYMTRAEDGRMIDIAGDIARSINHVLTNYGQHEPVTSSQVMDALGITLAKLYREEFIAAFETHRKSLLREAVV